MAVGLTALALFIWRELSFDHPLLELRVFRSRAFTLAIVTQWIGFAAMFGTFFLVPLFLQQVRGYGAFETGLILLPQAIASALFMQIGGRLFDRVGPRIPILSGLTVLAVAMWQMSRLTGSTTGLDIALPLILTGAGMGLMMMALNTHLLNNAPRDLTSRVTALTGALQNVVSSLAIATFATILQARLPVHIAEATQAAGRQPSPQALSDAGAAAFGDVYIVALGLIVVAWGLATTLKRSQPAPTSESEPARPVEASTQIHKEPVIAGH